ncbi:MAG TPA: hypothetical protein VFI79_10435 [Gemmatimonadales bacterium]|nr:hypothetical protein [Gemmatimonadales bacterium]
MSVDLELESWRREWRVDTEALPELKRRIRGQNRRMIAGAHVILVCLAIATVLGFRQPRSGWGGFAAGVWIATVLASGYTLWVRRGTWATPAATTEAYVELLYRRAVATLRKTVVLGRAMIAVLALYGGWLVLSGRHRTAFSGLVFAAFTVAILLMGVLERRRRRAMEEMTRLVDRASDVAEPSKAKRMDLE